MEMETGPSSSQVDQRGKEVQGYSRKDKSLGLLCENFLSLYGDGNTSEICLDDAAKRLSVERRRIYDIVNVMESISIVRRKQKNKYDWHGLQQVPSALGELREDAKQSPFVHALFGSCGEPDQEERAGTVEGEEQGGESDVARGEHTYEATSAQFPSSGFRPSLEEGAREAANEAEGGQRRRKENANNSRKEKSLELLSRKFLQLILVAGDKPISLDEAACALLGENAESRAVKTKVRRLYDIANILQSLNLIEKTSVPGSEGSSKRPAFRWLNSESQLTADVLAHCGTSMLWFIPYSKRREVERMNASNRRGTRSTAQQGVKRSWQEKGEAEPRGENITEANAENSSRNLAKHQRSEEPGGGGSEPPKMAQPQAVRPAIPKVPGANAGEEMQPLPAQHSTLTSGIPPSGPFVPTSTPPGDSSLAAHVSATAYIPSMSPQFQNAMAALHAAYNGGSSPRPERNSTGLDSSQIMEVLRASPIPMGVSPIPWASGAERVTPTGVPASSPMQNDPSQQQPSSTPPAPTLQQPVPTTAPMPAGNNAGEDLYTRLFGDAASLPSFSQNNATSRNQ